MEDGTPGGALNELIDAATSEGGAKGAIKGGAMGTVGGALISAAGYSAFTLAAAFSLPGLLGAAAGGALITGIVGAIRGAKRK